MSSSLDVVATNAPRCGRGRGSGQCRRRDQRADRDPGINGHGPPPTPAREVPGARAARKDIETLLLRLTEIEPRSTGGTLPQAAFYA